MPGGERARREDATGFEELKQLELFSGLGGFRLALGYAGIRPSHVTAVDVNDVANAVYSHSFGDEVVRRDIKALTVKWFHKLKCPIWTMSPPCQPYTRQGLQRDHEDPRAAALLHLIEVIKTMPSPPLAIVVENVKNFEHSKSFALLCEALSSRGYHWRSFLLSPATMGFPNQRLRFYLVAKQQHLPFNFDDLPDGGIYGHIPGVPDLPPPYVFPFLEKGHDDKLVIPPTLLKKPSARCFDVVGDGSTKTACVTKAYGRYIDGTGSVFLLPKSDKPATMEEGEPMSEFENRLRYFAPKEVARMMGFKLAPAPAHEVVDTDDLEVNTEHFARLPSGVDVAAERARAERLHTLGPEGHQCLPHQADAWKCACERFELPEDSNSHLWGCLGNSLNPQVVGLLVRACGLHKIADELAGPEV